MKFIVFVSEDEGNMKIDYAILGSVTESFPHVIKICTGESNSVRTGKTGHKTLVLNKVKSVNPALEFFVVFTQVSKLWGRTTYLCVLHFFTLNIIFEPLT